MTVRCLIRFVCAGPSWSAEIREDIEPTSRDAAHMMRHKNHHPATFGLALSAAAPCDVHAINILAPQAQHIEVMELYPTLLTQERDELDALCHRLKNLELSSYFECGSTARMVLRTCADTAAARIREIIEREGAWSSIVVGHPTLIAAVARALGCHDPRILTVTLKEGDGFDLFFGDEGDVTLDLLKFA